MYLDSERNAETLETLDKLDHLLLGQQIDLLTLVTESSMFISYNINTIAVHKEILSLTDSVICLAEQTFPNPLILFHQDCFNIES